MSKRKIDDNIVFNAALDEFLSRSYDDASLNTIIKNAQISKGSFYYRFENKYALYLFLIKTCTQKKWEYISSVIKEEGSPGESMDLFDQFLYQTEIGIRFANNYPRYFQLNKMFSKEKGTKLYDDILREIGNADDGGIETMVSEAYKRDEFNSRFSKEFITKVISHLFTSFDEVFFQRENYELDEAVKNLIDYVAFMRSGLMK